MFTKTNQNSKKHFFNTKTFKHSKLNFTFFDYTNMADK